jgi:hypothetical protein
MLKLPSDKNTEERLLFGLVSRCRSVCCTDLFQVDERRSCDICGLGSYCDNRTLFQI